MMRKYYILFILVFILFFFLTQGLLAQDFYVAPDGSDSTGVKPPKIGPPLEL